MNRISRMLFSVFASLLLILAPASFASSASSNVVAVTTSLSVGESVSISLSMNNIILTTSAPTQSLNITTNWVLAQGHTTGTLYTYFSVLPSINGGTQIGSNAFQTSLNNNASVFCIGSGFPTGIGNAGKDCSSFQLTQNLASDLNDSVVTPFSITFAPQANSFPGVGTYTNGQLVFLFVVS